jgi:hypothetical protein
LWPPTDEFQLQICSPDVQLCFVHEKIQLFLLCSTWLELCINLTSDLL